MNKYLNLLPTMMMFQMFLASIPYALAGKWGSALYWFAAGLLNLAVIFFIKRYG